MCFVLLWCHAYTAMCMATFLLLFFPFFLPLLVTPYFILGFFRFLLIFPLLSFLLLLRFANPVCIIIPGGLWWLVVRRFPARKCDGCAASRESMLLLRHEFVCVCVCMCVMWYNVHAVVCILQIYFDNVLTCGCMCYYTCVLGCIMCSCISISHGIMIH